MLHITPVSESDFGDDPAVHNIRTELIQIT